MSEKRPQTRQEEIANSASHGLGLLLAAAGVPLLISAATQRGEAMLVIGAWVFAGALILLYGSSTLYHALPAGRAKRMLRVIDHAAIFLLIAGTYTPFTLGALRGPWGWTLFGLVWGVCLFGIAVEVLGGLRYRRLSLCLYLVAGWLALVAIKPMLELVPLPGLAWILAGGVAYTVGVVFYKAHRVRYAHLAWHVFVMAGTGCHFVAVVRYA
jgi:hemolysin III